MDITSGMTGYAHNRTASWAIRTPESGHLFSTLTLDSPSASAFGQAVKIGQLSAPKGGGAVLLDFPWREGTLHFELLATDKSARHYRIGDRNINHFASVGFMGCALTRLPK